MPFFTILCDKGYIGSTPDTPNLRRIVPFKGETNLIEAKFNKDLRVQRIHIEQFFGKLKKSFMIFYHPYKLIFFINLSILILMKIFLEI